MAAIGGYRDGILKMADQIVERQETSKDLIANRKQEKWIFPKDSGDSPADYVVSWRSNKRQAQELVDSGEYTGDQLEALKKIADGPDEPPPKE